MKLNMPKGAMKALGIGLLLTVAGIAIAHAQGTPTPQVPSSPPPAPAGATPVPNKGDTAWMLVSTALVLMMSIPGLALFYGGLVRSKNMLSVLSQVFMIVALVSIIWCVYGLSLIHI